MANWIVRSNAPSATVEETRVVLRSKRRVAIKPGDELVLLSWEWQFTDKARVFEVVESIGTTLEGGEEKRWWEIRIDRWESLAREIALDEAATSLTFIRNWKRPKVHVRRAYRSLSDDDLETIERGDLFIAREAYLTFISALPPRLAQLFLAESPATSTGPRDIGDFAERAVALINFVEERVLSVGKVIMAAQRQWENLSSQIEVPKASPLYVCDDDDAAPPINISAQAQAFGALLPESDATLEQPRSQLTDIIEILTSPARQSVERRFERLFRDRIDERP